jgi:dTDP-4-dehydrorhamnose 3,5-epimerase
MKDITKTLNTDIEGLRLFQTARYKDERGAFIRHWEKETFSTFGLDIDFVQDNISMSNANVVRGLHIQEPGYEQGKLVRALTGAFLDVAVDLRTGSKTYGKYCAVELTELNGLLFWIPKGFAHGFKSLYDNSIFLYKCDAPYAPEKETGVKWNDSEIGINWNLKDLPIVSEKDEELLSLKEYSFKHDAEKIIR